MFDPGRSALGFVTWGASSRKIWQMRYIEFSAVANWVRNKVWQISINLIKRVLVYIKKNTTITINIIKIGSQECKFISSIWNDCTSYEMHCEIKIVHRLFTDWSSVTAFGCVRIALRYLPDGRSLTKWCPGFVESCIIWLAFLTQLPMYRYSKDSSSVPMMF